MHTPAERAEYSARIRAYEQTPLWAERARRFINTHGRYCDACGTSAQIDVHHRSYNAVFTGLEADEDLRALCRPDHDTVHDLRRRNPGWSLADATDHIIETRRAQTLPPTQLPRTYTYSPAIFDAYTKANPPRPIHFPPPPQRRRKPTRAARLAGLRHRRIMLYLIAVALWAFVIYHLATGR